MVKLIANGTLITAEATIEADILIDGAHIAAVAPGLQASMEPDIEIINAAGKWILPGGVDPHTHFDLPMFGTVSSDDHYTGHKAAAFGGTTTVIDFVPQEPGRLETSVELWRAKADPKAAVDFSFHMNITHFDGEIAAEIKNLPNLGISSLKVFTAYNDRLRLADDDIFRVMRIAAEQGLLTMLHAENGDVIDLLIAEALAKGNTDTVWHARTRPGWGAVEAALRGAALAAQTDAPLYLVHMNMGGEADMLTYARAQGVKMMGETCPQYLFFTEEHLAQPDGAKWVCSPPMRSVEDNQRLWKALTDGEIQTIGTDHCAFFYDGTRAIEYEGEAVAIAGKELGKDNFTLIPNGLPGVADRLPILLTYGLRAGRLTPQEFVALNCTNPARIFGLYPRKGALLPGSDADIVIWDPEKRVIWGKKRAHQRTDYNLYESWELQGVPEKVFLRGNLIVDGENWLGKRGMGHFLPRTGCEFI